MGKEIIQSSKIESGKFQLIIKETPLSKPDSYIMDSGLLLSEIVNKIPEGKGSVYVNGLQCIDNTCCIESGDMVEVVISPNEGVSAGVIIAAILASLAGAAIGYFLFKPPAPDGGDDEDDFSRISGLRNSERRYEPTGLVLGKRKVAPYYISRPYTLIEGNEEYFYALLSVGYGPLKLSNPRIGETPLSEFEHEITYLDHFENTSVEDLYNAYNADISQETVNQLLALDDPYTIRSVGSGSNSIDLDFLWPVGSYLTTRSKGRVQGTQSGVRVDFEQNGVRKTYVRRTHAASDIVGTVYNQGGTYYLRQGGNDVVVSPSEVNPYYVILTGQPENRVITSIYHSSPDKKQIAKSLSIAVDPQHATTVYVKKTTPLDDVMDYYDPPSEIQWMNLKSRRPLSFEKFKKGIGSERPLLRYEGGPVNGVETYRPVVIAIKLRATAQLNGTLDNFFIDAEMCVPQDKSADWRNWPSLALETSNNPVDAYKWLLQGPANYSALPNNKIDNMSLSEWRQTCINEGWAISDYLTDESTLLDEMKNVAFVGRAEFSFRDGKFGVVEKVEKTLPVQMFTNKNSASFQSARNYPEEVDGIKFEFDNAEIDYEKDEATFLDPVKAANPAQLKGKFQRVTLRGVDNYEHAYRLARFFYYETALQRETYKLKTDIEGLRCNRGDLVYIQNDVIRVSLGSGRIKSINGTTVVIDEQVGLEDRVGDQLGFVIRDKQGNFFFETATYNGNGQWECDLPNSSGVGDLVIYGESGSETLECIVRDIEYDEDLNVSLTLVNAANIIYQRDEDFIPEFESNVTPPTEIEIPQAPTIYQTPSVNLDTNEVTLTLLSTSNNRMEGLFYTVQQRSYLETSSDEESSEWETVATGLQGNLQFNVGNLQQGYTYQFRVQARRSNSTFSAWSNTATVEIEFGREMPEVEGVSYINDRAGTLLVWQRIENPFFDLYEIRLNDNFGDEDDEENLLDTTKGTTYNVGYLTEGQIYYIAAKNTAGRYGDSVQVIATPPTVNPVIGLTSNPEPDSEAFIDWEQPTENYSIIGYEVKRNLAGEASNEPTATSLGFFDSTFVSVREQSTGTYNYWVATKDASLRLSSWQSVSVDFIKSLNAASEIIEDARNRLEIVEFDVDELEQGFQQTEQDLADASDRIDQAEQNISNAADRLDVIDFDLGEFETELTDFKIDTGVNFTQINQRASDLEFRVQTETLTREESDLAILSSISNQAASREVLRQRNENNERLIDAVVTVDPDTGQIINRAFQYTDDQFTQAVFLIDGAEARITATVESIGLIEGEISDLSSQLELVPAQITATATAIVADAISSLEPAHVYNFFDSAQGWFAVNGSIGIVTPNQINLTWGDIQNDNINFSADENTLIRLTIERTAGTGWVGDLIVERDDSTTETFTGIIEEIPVAGEIIRNIDLRGNEDWYGVITSVRLVLGEDSNDTFIVKNITIGKPDASLLELEDITARVTNAELQIDALEGTITQKVDTTFYNNNTVTFGNVEQTLNAIDSYAALLVQSQQIDENDVITNATNAGQFIDGYEGTFTNYVTEIENEFDEVRDEYQSEFTDVRTELDSANGRITNQSFSIFQNREESQELGVQQLQSLVDVALFRAGQLDKDTNFAFAIQQLETDVSPEGALAQNIVNLEASTQANGDRITATNNRIGLVETDVEGNSSAIDGLSLEVGSLESDLTSTIDRVSQVEIDSGNNASAINVVEGQVNDPQNNTSGLFQFAQTVEAKADDTIESLTLLTSRVENNESEIGEARLELSAAVDDVGNLKTRAALVTDNNTRLTGLIVGDDGVTRDLAFLTDKAYFVDASGTKRIFFDLNEQEFTFDGIIKAKGGEFAGELLAATGTFEGSLEAADGTFTGSLVAATGTFEGELTAGSIITDSTITGSKFLTSDGTDYRVVIDPENNIPFWYGAGSDVNETNSTLMLKSDGSAIFKGELLGATGTFGGELTAATGAFEGNILAGSIVSDSTITGSTVTGGVIRTSAGTGFRTVIDPSNGYALWYGSGTVNDTNAQLMFKTDGTAEYRGFFDGTLAANSVRIGNLRQGADFTNLAPNGAFETGDLDGWQNTAGLLAVEPAGTRSDSASQNSPFRYYLVDADASSQSDTFTAYNTPVESGEELFVKMFSASGGGSTSNCTWQLRFSFARADGSFISILTVTASTTSPTWTKQDGVIVVPPEAAFINQIGLRQLSGGSGRAYVGGIEIRRRNAAALIVNGGIKTDMLAADLVLSRKVDVVNSGQRVLIDPEGQFAIWSGPSNVTPSDTNAKFFIKNDGTGFVAGEFFQGEIIESKSASGNISGGSPWTTTATGHQSKGLGVKVDFEAGFNSTFQGDWSNQSVSLTLNVRRNGTIIATRNYPAPPRFYNSLSDQTVININANGFVIDSRSTPESRDYELQVSLNAAGASFSSTSGSLSLGTFENLLPS